MSPKALAPKAKSVIVLFLSGGPSQLDMWDMKPDAPEEIRGSFRPIDTKVAGHSGLRAPAPDGQPGGQICDRPVGHARAVGAPGGGVLDDERGADRRPAPDASFMSRLDRPHLGSSLAKLLGPVVPSMPPFVMVPEAMAPNGPERAGQHAGFLGPSFDPYRINSDPNLPDYSPGVLVPTAGLTSERLHGRQALLDQLDGPNPDSSMDEFQAKAFDLLSSTAAQNAFDITAEPQEPPATATAGTSSASRPCWPGGWSRPASAWSTSTGSGTTTARAARDTTPTASTSRWPRTTCSRRPTPRSRR